MAQEVSRAPIALERAQDLVAPPLVIALKMAQDLVAQEMPQLAIALEISQGMLVAPVVLVIALEISQGMLVAPVVLVIALEMSQGMLVAHVALVIALEMSQGMLVAQVVAQKVSKFVMAMEVAQVVVATDLPQVAVTQKMSQIVSVAKVVAPVDAAVETPQVPLPMDPMEAVAAVATVLEQHALCFVATKLKAKRFLATPVVAVEAEPAELFQPNGTRQTHSELLEMAHLKLIKLEALLLQLMLQMVADP